MILSSLNLQNFRCFKKKNFEFSSKTTLIAGPNASGKTNILEAIYLLALGKSFRANRESEVINYGQELARIRGKVIADFSPRQDRRINSAITKKSEELEIVLTTGEVQRKRTARKLYKVNGVGKRKQDFVGKLKCVLFRPEDINLILGPPSIRRNYLDSVLEQIDWQYRVCRLDYKKGLRQRNKLLDKIRDKEINRSQLAFWDKLLIKNGQIITQKRKEMIDFFNDYFDSIEIFYDKSEINQERLEKYAQAELALGATLVGPHRDDFAILKIKNKKPKSPRKDFSTSSPMLIQPRSESGNQRGRHIKNNNIGRNLALYGSRGEQRMAVLYLKLAELEFMKKKTNQQPVLLLDDIFSELDKENKKLVSEIIDDCQTVITDTDLLGTGSKSIIQL